MTRILSFFARLVLTHYYGAWSRLYRKLVEARYAPGTTAHAEFVAHAATFPGVVEFWHYLDQKSARWRMDTWAQLFDAVSYPARADAIFEERAEDGAGLDCDEFATWATAVLRLKGAAWDVRAATMLTVTWLDAKGIIRGHNVCCVEWTDGTFSFIDYTLPGPRHPTYERVVADVMSRRAEEGSTLLAWARYDPETMQHIETH